VVNLVTVPTKHAISVNPQDNQFLPEKLALRRYFLDKYPSKVFRVIDCCAGQGVIWSELRKQYPCQYIGLDKKKVGHGVVRIAAERWLSQTEWSADVIDIDTYGEPWIIYESALENFVGDEVTIFLTYCNVPVNNAVGLMSNAVRHRLGLPDHWKIWHSRSLSPITTPAMLAHALTCGFEVVEAKKIVFNRKSESGLRWDMNFLYFYAGLRLRWLK
jgi:hypothetical protein